MRLVLQTISWLALAGAVVPSLLFFADKMELPTAKTTLLIATIVWFVATPMWMGRDNVEQQEAA